VKFLILHLSCDNIGILDFIDSDGSRHKEPET
jgi:hypothetical protein